MSAATSQSPYLQYASQADILRCIQKDDFYIAYLQQYLWDVIKSLPESWESLLSTRKWRYEIDLAVKALYFILTTGRGNKTLGEEYCDILQVDAASQLSPSITRRWILIALHILPHYLLKWIASYEAQRAETQRGRLLSFLTNGVVPELRRFHLALFFFFGSYFHLSKRLTKTRYLFASSALRPVTRYFLISSLLTAQMCFNTWKLLNVAKEHYLDWFHKSLLISSPMLDAQPVTKEKARDSIVAVCPPKPKSFNLDAESLKCLFCLSLCRTPTSTICGHICCWECIARWCLSTPTCPICRASCLPQQLVVLRHYEPSAHLMDSTLLTPEDRAADEERNEWLQSI